MEYDSDRIHTLQLWHESNPPRLFSAQRIFSIEINNFFFYGYVTLKTTMRIRARRALALDRIRAMIAALAQRHALICTRIYFFSFFSGV